MQKPTEEQLRYIADHPKATWFSNIPDDREGGMAAVSAKDHILIKHPLEATRNTLVQFAETRSWRGDANFFLALFDFLDYQGIHVVVSNISASITLPLGSREYTGTTLTEAFVKYLEDIS